MFTNKEQCKLLNLIGEYQTLTNKTAFYLLKEFVISEFYEKWNNNRLSKIKKLKKAKTDSFYSSNEWRTLRYKVLSAGNGKCECCGATAKSGAVLHVDHIKPKSKYPELALEFSNLQLLCDMCNMGKSTTDEIDWRENPYSTYNINALLTSF